MTVCTAMRCIAAAGDFGPDTAGRSVGDDVGNLLFERRQIRHLLLEHEIRRPERGKVRPQDAHVGATGLPHEVARPRSFSST